MGIRVDGGIGATAICPGNGGTGFDGDIGRLETGRSDGDNVLINCLDGSLAIGIDTFFGEVEIVNRIVNETADDQINNKPLPEGAFAIFGDISHGLT